MFQVFKVLWTNLVWNSGVFSHIIRRQNQIIKSNQDKSNNLLISGLDCHSCVPTPTFMQTLHTLLRYTHANNTMALTNLTAYFLSGVKMDMTGSVRTITQVSYQCQFSPPLHLWRLLQAKLIEFTVVKSSSVYFVFMGYTCNKINIIISSIYILSYCRCTATH